MLEDVFSAAVCLASRRGSRPSSSSSPSSSSEEEEEEESEDMSNIRLVGMCLEGGMRRGGRRGIDVAVRGMNVLRVFWGRIVERGRRRVSEDSDDDDSSSAQPATTAFPPPSPPPSSSS